MTKAKDSTKDKGKAIRKDLLTQEVQKTIWNRKLEAEGGIVAEAAVEVAVAVRPEAEAEAEEQHVPL